MIGYLFNSIGFGWGDLFLFVFSILAGVWVVRSSRRGSRSRAVRLVNVVLMLLALVPLVMLGLAFMGARANAPVAITAQSAPGSQEMAVNMESSINTQFRESEPTFTADGRSMYFNCHNADICVSRLTGSWEEGKWSPPERLGAPISTGYVEVEPFINAAGDKLYFQSNRPAGRLKGNPWLSPFVTATFSMVNRSAAAKLGINLLDGLGLGDVWVSYEVNGVWSEPTNLSEVPGEPPVNTVFQDHCLSFSADGKEAFWTSTRPGGFGGNDIWTSRRVDGKWTAPENLGPNVNSARDEHHSMLTPDSRSLYVTTVRDGGYGREDNYITTRDADGKWGPLVNLGPLLNGPGVDRCPAWTPDLKIFLFESTRAGGRGNRDIWWVYFKDVQGYPRAGVPISGQTSQPGALRAAAMSPLQTSPYMLHNEEGQFLQALGGLVSIKATSEQTGGVFNLFEVCCPPGFATPLHIHYTEDVAIYVLEGPLTLFWGSEKKAGLAGSYFFQPRGTPHGFRVEGNTPARILYGTIPAGLDRFVLEHPAPTSLAELGTAAARYKIELLGPLPD